MESSDNLFTKDVYYKAIESSDSGLWIYDIPKGKCFLSNRYYKMLGYQVGEFEGTMENLFKLLHPEDVEKTNQIFKDFFAGSSSLYRNEVRLKCKSGSYIDVLTQGFAERDENGKVLKFIGWNIDISALKDAQRKLDEERSINISQSRLAHFGLMAGGLAHEVNNPLTVIQIRSEMMLKSLKQGSPPTVEKMTSALESIQTSANRIAEIIRGLRQIADGGVEERKTSTTLQKVLKDVLLVCQGEITKKGIRIHESFSSDPFINANVALLSQVILNLINNSIDALEPKTDKDIWLKISSDHAFAYISVEDNGTGIKKEDQEKIMYPFYTTKEPGKGTGLGLSISKSIIQSQNGHIHFESGNGLTKFVVTLPLVSQ